MNILLIEDDLELAQSLISDFREQGYAVIDQELEPGLVAVAVPVRNMRGETVAAINICGHTIQTSIDKLTSLCLPEALRTAR